MKHKTGIFLMLFISCLLLNVCPAFAGEWQQTEDKKWQYIEDDGSAAIGWFELENKTYFFDDNGIRKDDYWLKDKGNWYYFDENGIMAVDTWVDNYYVDKSGKKVKQR